MVPGRQSGTRVVGLLPNGAWAERVAVPTSVVAPIPDGLGFEAASTVPVAGLTSLAALAHGRPLLGRRVLITGAAGGVGRFAVQLARLMGAEVTALVGGQDRAAGLADLGASAILTTLDPIGDEFDFVMESVGGPVLGAALARLASGGTLVSIGGSSDTLTTFDGLAFARKGPITMSGMSLFRELERQGMGSRELSDLLALMAGGRLDPQIARTASWRDMPALLEALGARQINGKAVALIDWAIRRAVRFRPVSVPSVACRRRSVPRLDPRVPPAVRFRPVRFRPSVIRNGCERYPPAARLIGRRCARFHAHPCITDASRGHHRRITVPWVASEQSSTPAPRRGWSPAIGRSAAPRDAYAWIGPPPSARVGRCEPPSRRAMHDDASVPKLGRMSRCIGASREQQTPTAGNLGQRAGQGRHESRAHSNLP